MKLRSLRARMIALSAAATLVALAVAGWAMAGILGGFVMQGLDQRLDAQLAIMASAVRGDGGIDRPRLEARLGLLDAGRGWRWRIVAPAGTLGSADFPRLDRHSPRGDRGPWRRERPDAPVPLDGEDGFHARQTTIATRAGPVTLTAAAPRHVVARPVRAALVPLLTALAALAGVFAVAALIQLRLGLRPVLRLRDQVAGIRAGTRERVDEDQPAELRPLAGELNAMAADSAAALAAARASAANLAHALKTPLATLALAAGHDPALDAQVQRLEGVIRHHLARARAAAVGRRATTLLAPALADVVQAIGALRRDVAIELAVPGDLAVAIDAHDLAEIAGNLIDNAARHARTTVRIVAREDGRLALLAIDDDGPGIAPERREAALRPGVRLDEGPVGDGFGLSIVHELLALYGGTIALDGSEAGGLRVTVCVPRG